MTARRCSQCGQPFGAPACGPTHAILAQEELDFSGATYDPELDRERLTGQWRKVWEAMAGEVWRTLDELQDATGIRSHASISARLRDFRKEAFGRHTVNRRRRPGLDPQDGVFEYQLVPRRTSTDA